MNQTQRFPVGIGVITIFTVLIVLCLSVFATLTLTTARADLSLSRINAQTVTAWYEADAKAARLYADFRAGTGDELEETIPVTDNQVLHLHLARMPDGTVSILSWNTEALPEGGTPDDTLNLWDGTAPR